MKWVINWAQKLLMAFRSRTQDAVIHNLEVIGEAAKRIPEIYRQQHPSVPWLELAGFRDIFIH